MSRLGEWWRYRRQRRADQRAYRKDRRTSASEKQQRLREHRRTNSGGSGQDSGSGAGLGGGDA
jgi:hypothetical protein